MWVRMPRYFKCPQKRNTWESSQTFLAAVFQICSNIWKAFFMFRFEREKELQCFVGTEQAEGENRRICKEPKWLEMPKNVKSDGRKRHFEIPPNKSHSKLCELPRNHLGVGGRTDAQTNMAVIESLRWQGATENQVWHKSKSWTDVFLCSSSNVWLWTSLKIAGFLWAFARQPQVQFK